MLDEKIIFKTFILFGLLRSSTLSAMDSSFAIRVRAETSTISLSCPTDANSASVNPFRDQSKPGSGN